MIGQRSTTSAALMMLAGLVVSPYCARRACAQSPFQDTGGPAAVRVQAGPGGTKIAVQVNRAPAEGDSIHVVTNTSRMQASLILPDGRRIGIATPESSGFRWTQSPNRVPLGSNDGGYQVDIIFTKPSRAGGYTILFTSDATERGALAQAWFTSRMQQFEGFVQSLPSAQIAESLQLNSGAAAKVEVKTAMHAFLDVVVPSDSIEVTLTLPYGRIVRRDDAKAVGIDWTVENDSDGQGLGFLSRMVLPLKGNHHMIGLPNATPGTYVIGAKAPAGTTGELRAVLLPFDEAAKSLGREMFGPSHAGVTMQLSSPFSDHFVGDQVELTVRLNGALDARPPEFVVRAETHPYLPSLPSTQQGGGRRLGPAGAVVTVPAMFHKDSDGVYRSAIPLREAGWTRVAVRAKGTKAGGEPFEVEEATTIPTYEIVARVAEVQARGKDENGDGKFQSLEVALDVDVMVPGSYMFATSVLSAAKEAIHPIVMTKQLGQGRQRVTAVVPSGQIWNQLHSGPLEVQASPTLVLGSGIYVPLPGNENLRRQLEYRREQWAPGAYQSQDAVTVHGIRPSESGRYSIAEIAWEATTPGGQCGWVGQLTDGKHERHLFDRHYQRVPAGLRKFSFFFDGAAIAAAGTRDWVFEADVACGDRKNGAKLPAAPLDLNSEDYQTSQGALEFDGDVALSQTAPEGRYWETDPTGLAAKGNGADSAHFEITQAPEGWKANVHSVRPSPSTNPANLFVEPAPDASPGRYFIQVTVVAGEQRVTREFIVELFELVQ